MKVRLLFIFIFCVGYLSVSYYAKVFLIQTVTCTAQDSACSEPIIAEINRLKNLSFFSPEIDQTFQKIKRSDPSIRQILLKKSFPSTLQVLILHQSSTLEIVCEDTVLSLDQNGQLITKHIVADQNTPQLKATLETCESIESQKGITTIELIQLTQLTQTAQAEYQLHWETLPTVRIMTKENQSILVSTSQADFQFRMYKYLLEQNMLSSDWSELDLRFQKAILKNTLTAE